MAYFAYVRHGLSQANIDGVVAGHSDTPLTDIGREQARDTGMFLKDITFHHAFGSPLERARKTLDIILSELQQSLVPSFHEELKERDWGVMEGGPSMIKARRDEFSDEEIALWFTWEGKGPKGFGSNESYKDMSDRIAPFFKSHVLPKLKAGENVLMVSHNGISKPLQRYLENLPYESTHSLDLKNCEVKLYEFDTTGTIQKISSRTPQNSPD